MSKLYIIFLLAFSGVVFGQSTNVSFQPSVSTGLDAVLTSSAATTNNGTNTTFQAMRDASNNKNRSLLMFDLSSIPATAIISSAKLTLYGTAHSGTNPSYLRKNTTTWDEATVTWNTAPSTSTVGQISLAQSTVATQNYTMDVTSFVQDMVNIPATNYGWTLIKQDETSTTGSLIFGSSDSRTASQRPLLEITYSMPMDVKGYMTPATGLNNADGALNVTVTNGVPPYTYSWSDASTTKDIYNKLPGLYTLTVTDNLGNQVKKHMMIGAENASVTFTITPDALSGKDGAIQLKDDGTLANNNYKDLTQLRANRWTASGWFKTRSLLSYDLFCMPSNAVVNSATLQLYGNGHNPLSRPNDSYLYLNTQSWDEPTLTWNTQPAHTSSNSIYMAGTTSSNENTSVNVTSHVQNWVQNPSSNFGWKLALADEVTASYTSRAYGSSDNTTAGLRPSLIITITIPVLSDAQRNWTMEETYDQNGQVISTQKVYLDDLGRTTQGLNKDASGDVFANQTVYDAYGRAALSSLPAYAGNSLTYKTNLFLNTTGQEYNYTNFDVTGKITSPDPVQTGINNTVGYYYSDNNALDTWQATTSTPYSRTQFMGNPMGEIKTTNAADNNFNAASGREARNYSMVCGDELKFILGTGNSYKVQTNAGNPLASTALTLTTGDYIKATKSITTSPDNKEIITYSIGDKVVATCMSGLSSPDNCSMTTMKNYMDWYGTQSIDIHVPDANKSSLSFPLPTYVFMSNTYTVSASDISYVITDQRTETVLQSAVDYTINASTRALTFSSAYLTANTGKPLFLRITVAYTPSFVASLGFMTSVPRGIVQYNLDYGRWTVNYYDLGGNLRKNVSAMGINCGSPGTISMATVYDYSHLGQLVATQSPDEGLVEYAYNTNGQLRFTQNAEQKLNNRFSYINYDLHGRNTESGEFSNISGSGTNGLYFQNYYNAYTAPYTNNVSTSTIIDNVDGISDTYCNDVYHSSYEALSSGDDIPSAYTYASNYAGKYKNGQVSKTWNSNTSTWYKYDAAGQLIATVQQINDGDFVNVAGTGDAQIKTYETTYDPYFGYATNSYYQKNVSNEYAEHQYNYDANKRLTTTNFIAGSGNTPTTISTLSYDKSGRLKRQVVGPDLQGVDYVYTLSGKVKAINHPSLDYTKDRGGDNRNYNGTGTGVYSDLFGEILEYYPGDYTRSGTSIEANTNGLYNGQIYGSRYKTRDDVNGTNTGANYIDYLGSNQLQLITTTNYGQQELANRYTYDAFGQLANSTFGTFNNSTNTFTSRNEYKEFGPTNNSIGYDENGNINRLQRNAYIVSGSTQLLDNLTYTYTANTNKHSKVGDAAVNSYPSSFNFKNQTGTPATINYNTIGQMTANADENISSISYYPNGQIKQITFSSGNTSTYYYNDQGQKYKTKYYNASAATYKYNWYLFGTVYEYISNVGSFNLTQLSVGGQGRAGVYKQDATGIAIGTGHLEYELTDHLGNVRVTFKKGTGSTLQVLSKNDYYAFGGTLPGRTWQQSGGDYRFGYQGQEKSQMDVNWDEFELRQYNHDLGRWSAPDPYGQFHSPYLAMGNNPVSMVDPNGGYINQSSTGQAQAKRWFSQLKEDRFLHRGRFSFEFVYANYTRALDELYNDHFGSNWTADQNEFHYLEDLYKLNNQFMGLGLDNTVMSCGRDQVSQTTLWSDYGKDLMWDLTSQNGSRQMAQEAAAQLPGPAPWIMMSPADRDAYASARGIDNGFTFYNHYAGGKYQGTYTSIDKAYQAVNDFALNYLKDNLQLEWQNNSALASSGKDLYSSTSTGSLRDYEQTTGKILNFHFVFEGRTPEIYRNTSMYLMINPQSAVLTYNGGGAASMSNRMLALMSVSGSAGPGRSWDEYPYASTEEGGLSAMVWSVPARENSIQGGQLRWVYNGMSAGQQFLVVPVSSSSNERSIDWGRVTKEVLNMYKQGAQMYGGSGYAPSWGGVGGGGWSWGISPVFH